MDSKFSQFDGGIPEHYDHGLGPNIFADYAGDLARRVAGHEPRRVLEEASGTGIATRMLRDALHEECVLTATDLNEGMLEVARRKFGEDERVQFRLADAQSLCFDDAAFDLVTCQFGVMFFPDKVAAYREALRVLEPGGRYVFSLWCSFEDNPFSRVAHETVCALFHDDPPGFYEVPFSYHDAEEVSASLEAVGFTGITTELVPITKVVDDHDRFAHGLVFGNPLVDEIRTRGEVTADEVKRAIAAALRAEFGPEPSAMPLLAMVVTGVRP